MEIWVIMFVILQTCMYELSDQLNCGKWHDILIIYYKWLYRYPMLEFDGKWQTGHILIISDSLFLVPVSDNLIDIWCFTHTYNKWLSLLSPGTKWNSWAQPLPPENTNINVMFTNILKLPWKYRYCVCKIKRIHLKTRVGEGRILEIFPFINLGSIVCTD